MVQQIHIYGTAQLYKVNKAIYGTAVQYSHIYYTTAINSTTKLYMVHNHIWLKAIYDTTQLYMV